MNLMLNKSETVDTYLKQGAAHYPNGADLNSDSMNYVIGGHSSKLATDTNAF